MKIRGIRLVLAVLIVAVAVGGAFVLRGYRLSYQAVCPNLAAAPSRCVLERRPARVDPAALGLMVLGVAVAIGVVAARGRERRSGYADGYIAAVTVGAAFLGAFVLHGQREIVYPYGTFPGGPGVAPWTDPQRPSWADPVAVLMLVLGAAVASAVVAAHGRSRQPPPT